MHILPLRRPTLGSAVLRVGAGSRAWFFQLLGSLCQKAREEGVEAVAGGEGWEWRGEAGGGGAGRLHVFRGRISFSLETLSGLLPSTPLPQLSFPGTEAGSTESQAHLGGCSVTSPASVPEPPPPALPLNPGPCPQLCLVEENRGSRSESHLPPHWVTPNQSHGAVCAL